MSEKRERYHSYLLRIWRSGAGRDARWQADLEDTRTGERRGFASLAAAFAFLDELASAEEPRSTGGEEEVRG